MSSISTTWANNPDYVPDRQWKKWTKQHLPSSKDCWISDIDSVIRSRFDCVMLVEIKRRDSSMSRSQLNTYGMIAGALKACEGQKVHHPSLKLGWIKIKKFIGIVELIFENSWFDNGKVWIRKDGGEKIEIDEQKAIDIFSFKADCFDCYPASNCGNCNCPKI